MDSIIQTLQVPYRGSIREYVPQDAEVVHVEASITHPQYADIYYRTEVVSESEQDTLERKRWELAVISDEEAFPSVAKHVGTFIQRGYAYHVLRLNPYDN